MKILTLVIWVMCFFPMQAIGNYFHDKGRQLEGKSINPYSGEIELWVFVIMIAIILIFQK